MQANEGTKQGSIVLLPSERHQSVILFVTCLGCAILTIVETLEQSDDYGRSKDNESWSGRHLGEQTAVGRPLLRIDDSQSSAAASVNRLMPKAGRISCHEVG